MAHARSWPVEERGRVPLFAPVPCLAIQASLGSSPRRPSPSPPLPLPTAPCYLFAPHARLESQPFGSKSDPIAPRGASAARETGTRKKNKRRSFFFDGPPARWHSSWQRSLDFFKPRPHKNKTARPARWPTSPSTWTTQNLQNVRGGKSANEPKAPCIAGGRGVE